MPEFLKFKPKAAIATAPENYNLIRRFMSSTILNAAGQIAIFFNVKLEIC